MLILVLLVTFPPVFYGLGALLKWLSHKIGIVPDAIVGLVIPLPLFLILFLGEGYVGPIIYAAAFVSLVIGYSKHDAQSGKSRRKCGPPPQ